MNARNIKFFSLVLVLVFTSICTESCKKDKTEAKKESITTENIQGRWYNKNTDEKSGMTMIMYLENTADSAKVGLLNGNEEVELFHCAYSVSNSNYSFILPPIDTANQNALQIYFASDMDFTFVNEQAYIQNNNLCFVESSGVYTFTSEIPTISGGKIIGSLTLSSGKFNDGMVMVAAVDVNTNKMQATFVVKPGQYNLWGLENGHYNVMAIYIPKKHATDFTDYDVTVFPYTVFQSPLTISGGTVINGFNINIDLANLSNFKNGKVLSAEYSLLFSKILRQTKNILKPILK